MKALLSREPGGPDTLEIGELPDREPGKGEIRVKVLACGINYPEVLIIEDKYQVKPPRPFAPGSEIAGVVERTGPDAQGVEAGAQQEHRQPHATPLPAWSDPPAHPLHDSRQCRHGCPRRCNVPRRPVPRGATDVTRRDYCARACRKRHKSL